jgi:hypothetical protein
MNCLILAFIFYTHGFHFVKSALDKGFMLNLRKNLIRSDANTYSEQSFPDKRVVIKIKATHNG